MAHPTGNPSANPFDHAFEMLGQMPEVTTDKVNAEALELLTQALTSRATERGRMILLRSPRAGFGKTHLLMRLHQRVAHTHEFIPLEPSKGRYLDAQSVLDAVLRRFSRVLPAGGGLTVLDLLARRILATGLEPLVKSGEVPSQDRESALQALQLRPVETFDFHNEEAVTARWAMANFSLLGPRLTAELAERTHAGYRPVAWWVELLFRYSSASVDQTSRNSSLFETVFGKHSMETDMHEKLFTLLNLTGLVTSPVLILDEVEGFSSNPEAALQVATFLNSLHQSCGKLALIISVNGDVWETAFLPRIPCGLKDRLSDIVIDLKPMDKDVALSLLKDRAGERADAIADHLDFDTGVTYARGLIREASSCWEKMAAEQAALAPDDQEMALDPISLLAPEELEAPESQETVDESVEVDRELHPPAEVVIPDSEPAAGPPTEQMAAVESGQLVHDPLISGTVTPEAGFGVENPPLPDDLPQPFNQSATRSAVEPSTQPLTQPVASSESHYGSQQEVEQPVRQGDIVSFTPLQEQEQNQDQEPTPEPAPAGESPAFVPGQGVASPFNQAPDDNTARVEAGAETPGLEPSEMYTTSPTSDPHVPRNVVDSPFSIDTGATNVPSPFESVQAAQSPSSSTASVSTSPAQSDPALVSPFSVDDGKPDSHTVTENDHEKVEDLLKQFRDRYGRD